MEWNKKTIHKSEQDSDSDSDSGGDISDGSDSSDSDSSESDDNDNSDAKKNSEEQQHISKQKSYGTNDGYINTDKISEDMPSLKNQIKIGIKTILIAPLMILKCLWWITVPIPKLVWWNDRLAIVQIYASILFSLFAFNLFELNQKYTIFAIAIGVCTLLSLPLLVIYGLRKNNKNG